MRKSHPLARARATRMSLPRLLTSAALVALVVGGCECGDDLAAIPGNVSGNLCSAETGRPLPGHKLKVESRDEVVEVQTDLFGKYEARGVRAGPATVSAEVDGETRTWEVTVVAGETVEIADEECRTPPVPPSPAGSIVGCVCDEQRGHWVEGANVWIVTASGEPFATGTDDAGCFVLDGVPPGEHVLKIQQGAFYREEHVVVTDGVELPLETPEVCEAPEEPPPPPSGSVSGRVCAPDGTTWLAGATVSAETEDGVVETTTDADGYYTLSGVPVGEDVAITIRKGSFETVLLVDIVEGGTVTIPEEQCAIDQNVRIAVVNGQFDDVKSVLLNVGIDAGTITEYHSDWATALLTDYAHLAQYDIVFVNCGVSETAFLYGANASVLRDNLRQFVQNGGSVYASDQAYDIVEVAFPSYIDFYGDDNEPQQAQVGRTANAIHANVVDLALATMLGTNTMELHYPLPLWAVMESVSAQVRVYIRGDAPVPGGLFGQTLSNVPHTVSFTAGQGKVVYTSFHQEPGINQQMERVLQLLVFEL